jgi:cell wall-associated NlpC family hydrolase
MLHRGSQGAQVLALQRSLAQAGFNPHGLDGHFGPKTEAALRSFQRAKRLTVDGRAGPQTFGALRQHAASPSHATSSLGARSTPSSFDPGPTGPTAPTGKGTTGMLNWAQSKIGSPYAAVNPFRFGDVPWDGKAHKSVNGSSTVWKYPKGTQVFDCSGFVVAAFRQKGVDLAAHGLASSQAMANDHQFLQSVSRSQLRPGDIITYAPHNGIGHVVIYLGNNKCIQAGGGSGVGVVNVDWSRVNAMKRVPGT